MQSTPSLPPIAGSFSHPLIGVTRAPAGVTGDGHIRPTLAGLEIVAKSSSTGATSAFGCLGALIGLIVTGVVSGAMTKAGIEGRLGGLIFFAFLFGGLAIGRKIGKEKPLAVTIAWDKIRDPEVIGPNLTFLSKQKPKGMIYFTTPDQGALQFVLGVLRSGGRMGG